MTYCQKFKIVGRGMLVATLVLLSNLVSAQENGLLQFVEPSDGQVFAPGDTVAVILTIDQSIVPDRVALIPSFGSPLEAVAWTNGPYETTYTIPESFDGEISLAAFAMDAENPSVGLSEASIKIQVRSSIAPIAISVSPIRISQNLSESDTYQETIVVSGSYPGGEKHNLNFAGSGTNFLSLDPAVASVDAAGNVTGQSEGVTFVKVTNGDLAEWVGVYIYTPGGPPLPPIDHTADVSIAAGGFRYDPARNAYVQSVLITNLGVEPIHRPLALLLNGLPDGVNVRQAEETENILPLETPWVPITDFSGTRSFFKPGDSAKVEISFVNSSGVPITYVPKLYSAEEP